MSGDRWALAALALNELPTGPRLRGLHRWGAEALWQRLRPDAARRAGYLDPDEHLDRAAEVGARFVVPGDDEWPPRLAALQAFATTTSTPELRAAGRDLGQPFGLWVRGGPLHTPAEAVAVVGARAATAYGTAMAMELGTGLAERGYDVVSGAAFGIDAAAHRGALAGLGRTVAVLACGVDVPYPLAHEALLAVIARDGVVASECPPGTRPGRGTFLRRNRLIAGMSVGTVLVEAGLRSGARNTLAHARALERCRWVVPGPVTSGMSAGCHATLRLDLGSRLVTSAADIAEDFARIGDLEPLPAGPTDVRDALGERARDLLELLPGSEVWSTSRVADELGLSAPEVLVVVGALTEHGLLERTDAGVRLTVLGRQPTARAG